MAEIMAEIVLSMKDRHRTNVTTTNRLGSDNGEDANEASLLFDILEDLLYRGS